MDSYYRCDKIINFYRVLQSSVGCDLACTPAWVLLAYLFQAGGVATISELAGDAKLTTEAVERWVSILESKKFVSKVVNEVEISSGGVDVVQRLVGIFSV